MAKRRGNGEGRLPASVGGAGHEHRHAGDHAAARSERATRSAERAHRHRRAPDLRVAVAQRPEGHHLVPVRLTTSRKARTL